jgi:hypothetical protein
MKRFAAISLAFAVTTIGPFWSVSAWAEEPTGRTAVTQNSSPNINPAEMSPDEHASVTLSASQLNALRIGSPGNKPDFIDPRACFTPPL